MGAGITAREVVKRLEALVGHFGADEYFHLGDPDVQVTGILVCWKARLDAIAAARERRCNLLICHEDVFYPYAYFEPHIERYLHWKVNRQRIAAASAAGLTIFRAHGCLDRLCIYGTFARLWGLDCPVRVESYDHVFAMAPTTVAALAEKGKKAFGLETVRIAGDPGRVVSRAGLPWGGMGLSLNMKYVQRLVELGADVLICGECDEYVMHAALDLDIPIVETSHVASETPGLRAFAEMFQSHVGEVPVHFFDQRCPWVVR